MRDRFGEIRARGAALAVVVCQNAGAVRARFAADPHPFPIAIDEDRRVAKAFGVHYLLGFTAVNVARTSSFVIDGAGIIRHRFLSWHKWERLPIDDLLRALDAVVRA